MQIRASLFVDWTIIILDCPVLVQSGDAQFDGCDDWLFNELIDWIRHWAARTEIY